MALENFASLNHPNIGHIYGLQASEGWKALPIRDLPRIQKLLR